MKKIHVSFCIIIFLFIATLIICINYSSASAKDFNEYKNLLKQTLANENWQEMNRISDDVIRIVYSTISDTKCAYAKVYLQN